MSFFDCGLKSSQTAPFTARAVVYNRLMEKEEGFESDSPYPHMDAEALVLQIVGSLDLERCRERFGRIRHLGVRESLALALQNTH